MILIFFSTFPTIIIFSLIIIFLVTNCSFCHKGQRSHDEINSPYENFNSDSQNYISDNAAFKNPEPAHPSQIPKDQDFAEFPSITSQIETVSINSSSTTPNEQGERLQASVLVYPPKE